MPNENVPFAEGLEVVQAPASEVPSEAHAPEQADPVVPPRVVTPEEAREKALSGIPVEGQPISGSGQ